ncbi:hypothetical protein Pmani_025244 [Petrolisthes manimaculis]|uniref:Uncharacterized protein n=1 Tax=Petrolisthes manimaculis TaxID=1843537 RepID=A0AAE1U1C9_9EUCA|nr:hypothetical protein Pmani_025244 [Petrolisthes manimaculis]
MMGWNIIVGSLGGWIEVEYFDERRLEGDKEGNIAYVCDVEADNTIPHETHSSGPHRHRHADHLWSTVDHLP